MSLKLPVSPAFSPPPRLAYASVLVTGGGGFVGSALLPRLRTVLSQSSRLVSLTRDAGGGHHVGEAIQVDLTDATAIDKTMAEISPDLVIHLAAQSSVGAARCAEDTYRINVGGTLHLAQALTRHVPRATFLFASSAEVYGASFRNGVASESTTLAPLSPYARSKVAAEYLLQDVLDGSGIRLVIARPSNHSGRGQDDRFVLPSFARQIAEIEAGLTAPILKVGNLASERDFLDVDDVVDAYVALVAAPQLRHTVYNISSGAAVPISELLDGLRRAARVHTHVEVDPARLRISEVPRAAVDPARVMHELGWTQRRPVAGMLMDVLDDARRHISDRS